MTESLKEVLYKDALKFRESLYDSTIKIFDYFQKGNAFTPDDLHADCYEKFKDFQDAWTEVIKFYLIQWEVEQGIISIYHPLDKLPKSLENMQKKYDKKIKDLEDEIKKMKEVAYVSGED